MLAFAEPVELVDSVHRVQAGVSACSEPLDSLAPLLRRMALSSLEHLNSASSVSI